MTITYKWYRYNIGEVAGNVFWEYVFSADTIQNVKREMEINCEGMDAYRGITIEPIEQKNVPYEEVKSLMDQLEVTRSLCDLQINTLTANWKLP